MKKAAQASRTRTRGISRLKPVYAPRTVAGVGAVVQKWGLPTRADRGVFGQKQQPGGGHREVKGDAAAAALMIERDQRAQGGEAVDHAEKVTGSQQSMDEKGGNVEALGGGVRYGVEGEGEPKSEGGAHDQQTVKAALQEVGGERRAEEEGVRGGEGNDPTGVKAAQGGPEGDEGESKAGGGEKPEGKG